MADYAPVYGADMGEAVTLTAGAAITGGQALVYTDVDTVQPSSGASQAFAGIAGHDAASGAPVTVHMGAGVVHETQTTAVAVAAGALIAAAAGGLIAGGATAGAELGVAVRAVGGSGGLLRWKTTRG
jgi:Uncharacterized conserved protein (DUF2190)